jgi:uncharacterized membrane protein YfcA
MVCYITCAFAVAFLVASLYIMFTTQPKSSEMPLNPKEKIIYQSIVKERLKIYLIASFIGAILGIIYILAMKNKTSNWSLICTAVLIFFLVQLVIYMIYPKSDYMLNHINNNTQARAWLEMYNGMMRKFWIGFFLGLIGYGLICLAFIR